MAFPLASSADLHASSERFGAGVGLTLGIGDMAGAGRLSVFLASFAVPGSIQIATPVYAKVTRENKSAPRHNLHLGGASVTQELPNAKNNVITAATKRRTKTKAAFHFARFIQNHEYDRKHEAKNTNPVGERNIEHVHLLLAKVCHWTPLLV